MCKIITVVTHGLAWKGSSPYKWEVYYIGTLRISECICSIGEQHPDVYGNESKLLFYILEGSEKLQKCVLSKIDNLYFWFML